MELLQDKVAGHDCWVNVAPEKVVASLRWCGEGDTVRGPWPRNELCRRKRGCAGVRAVERVPAVGNADLVVGVGHRDLRASRSVERSRIEGQWRRVGSVDTQVDS